MTLDGLFGVLAGAVCVAVFEVGKKLFTKRA
jgi:hypothetical protein